jgi:transposase-like protein
MSRQNPTNPDAMRYALSSQQEAVVDLLGSGMNISEAAEKVGVTRQTVSEWVNRNPAFQAGLNRRRQELWAEASDKLRSLLSAALALLEQAVKEGNIRAAIAVLRSAGLEHLPPPEGATEPDEIETANKEAEAARANRALMATLR